MAVAAIVDPRYKFQIVEWRYEKAYVETYKSEWAIMKQKLVLLFNGYLDESKLKNSKDGQPTCGSLNTQEGPQDILESASLLMDFDNFSAKEIRYPTLAQMARDVLTLPISTVASESTFSTGDRVLDAY
ncbi:unnamed protein product [Lactuca saligna]|uniref:HAT C-terminal dimerisation domain-containing protein n=1 Tax=Lactuca saligna TaxID=75948 RepID=A0AA36E0K7_LACSI|nr:unnamed protein product [Lactuca saligna]